MKIVRIAIIAAALLLPAVSSFAADFNFSVEGGRYVKDLGENYIGVQGTFLFGNWSLDPSIHYLLVKDAPSGLRAGFGNLDLDYHFPTASRLAPWLGVGLGRFEARLHGEHDGSTNAMAVAGVEWKRSGARPYLQARLTRSIDNDFNGTTAAVGLGVRFGR